MAWMPPPGWAKYEEKGVVNLKGDNPKSKCAAWRGWTWLGHGSGRGGLAAS